MKRALALAGLLACVGAAATTQRRVERRRRQAPLVVSAAVVADARRSPPAAPTSTAPTCGCRSRAPTSSRPRSARACKAGRLRRRQHEAARRSSTTRACSSSRSCSRPTSSCSRCPTDSRHRVARRPDAKPGVQDRDRLGGRAGRLVHAGGAGAAACRRRRDGDPRERALERAGREGHRRQADAGRRRRGVRLRDRRERHERGAEGDRRCPPSCSPRSPTGPPS